MHFVIPIILSNVAIIKDKVK